MRMRSWFASLAVLPLFCLVFIRLALAQADDSAHRRVRFSTGYFAPRVELPARSGTLWVNAIELAGDAWTDEGGSATLLLDESRLKFNLFGDATVEEKKLRPLEVNCERLKIEDKSGEDRLLYHVRLPADTLLVHVYLVVAPRGISPHRLLIVPKEIQLSTPPNRRGWDLEMNHVLPLTQVYDVDASAAAAATDQAVPAWLPTRVVLATHQY